MVVVVVVVFSAGAFAAARNLGSNGGDWDNGGWFDYATLNPTVPTNVELYAYNTSTQQNTSVSVLSGLYGEYSEYNTFAIANGRLFFQAFNANDEWELWSSDGSQAGTDFVATLATNSEVYYTAPAVYAFNNAAYYIAPEPTLGDALWRSDGTPAGTSALTCASRANFSAKATSASLYLAVDDCTNGYGLYRLTAGQSTMTPIQIFNNADLFVGVVGIRPAQLFGEFSQFAYPRQRRWIEDAVGVLIVDDPHYNDVA